MQHVGTVEFLFTFFFCLGVCQETVKLLTMRSVNRKGHYLAKKNSTEEEEEEKKEEKKHTVRRREAGKGEKEGERGEERERERERE